MKVLFIAYHFPPIGGAGAQRSSKFARYLPQFGVEPVVVAGPIAASSRWEPEDPSQVAELPSGTHVYRPQEAPPELTRPSRRVQVLGLPSERDRWWKSQIVDLGTAASRDHRLDAIYVSLLPYEGLDAAVALGERLQLPVVADLRDPWALDEVRLYLSGIHRGVDRRRMGSLLDRCARVIGNTPDASAAFLDAFPSLDGRISTITNGYDAADFEGVEVRPPDGTFRIVHTGYLHTAIALAQERHAAVKRLLRGALWPIDLLGRTHVYLLRAVELLHRTHPDLAARTEIVLAGVMSDQDERVVRSSPVVDQVRMLGYVDHGTAIAEMVGADALFLPMHDIPPGRRARIVPGKTYEYLASGRPILAAVPPGDGRDLIAEMDAGKVADPTDVDGIARAVVSLAADAPTPRRVPAGVERFERRRLTERLAELMLEL